MDTLPVHALIPIAVILAALIGGFFSLISLIISKEQKVSEFRQQWIDSLRKEISDHIAASITLFAKREEQSGSNEQFLKEASEDQYRVVYTFTAIKLRINPNESNEKIKEFNNKFLSVLEECRYLYNCSNWKDGRLCCNRLTDVAIPMLKEEWKRVKRGETAYVNARRATMSITAVALLGSIVATYMFWQGMQNEEVDLQQVEQVEQVEPGDGI